MTTRTNPTADRIVQALTHRRTPVIRVDLRDVGGRIQLDAHQNGGGWRGTLTSGPHTVRLESVGAVWWWHPQPVRIPPGPDLSPAEATWASDEATAGLAGVLASLPCLHVNHPTSTHAAQCKPDVLVQAIQHGLASPPTWIGNRLPGAAIFTSRYDDIVTKSIRSPSIRNDESKGFYTTPAAILDESISRGVHLLQHRVAAEFEVRLTTVGGTQFAIRIDRSTLSPDCDIRADYEDHRYTAISVPAAVSSSVARLMKHYRLHYAAMDLLVTRDGEWQLVDLNPAGQFGRMEDSLPQPAICAALADVLSVPLHR
ncbi:MvdC/MvdD family ATP grasp protein [Streptomyces sp. NPDC054765]